MGTRRQQSTRRDRRKAKASKWAREPTAKPKQVGHHASTGTLFGHMPPPKPASPRPVIAPPKPRTGKIAASNRRAEAPLKTPLLTLTRCKLCRQDVLADHFVNGKCQATALLLSLDRISFESFKAHKKAKRWLAGAYCNRCNQTLDTPACSDQHTRQWTAIKPLLPR